LNLLIFSETPEFTKEKESGGLAANMGRAPVMFVSGEIAGIGQRLALGQSRALERYVARKCLLMGKTDEEEALIDCIAENVRDIKEKWGKIKFIGGRGPNAEKTAAMDAWFSACDGERIGEFATWLGKLEASLPSPVPYLGPLSPDPLKFNSYCVGTSTSYADVCVWQLLRDSFDGSEADQTSEAGRAVEALRRSGATRLSAVASRVDTIPQVSGWLAKRPHTMF
jgi:hypothetical protein